MSSSSRRVVVTGLGVVSPVGTGVREPWEAVLAGRSGIGPVERFDASRMKTTFAGEVSGFDTADYMPPQDVRKMDRFIQYALGAGVIAMRDAGLDLGEETKLPVAAERFGAVVGVGMGGLPIMEETAVKYYMKNSSRIPPFFIPQIIPNLAAGHIAIRYGLKGPCMCPVSACASGTHGVGEAFSYIQRGVIDAAVCGGSESTIAPLAIGGFNSLRALSTRNDNPTGASRPFDYARDGFVIAEGAGILILEELSVALERGARIYAEVVGYGVSGDGYHMTAPDPEGGGAFRCMKMAVDESGLAHDAYGYVNAHGTSTLYNDYTEVEAIKRLFGAHAYKMAVSSTKSCTGHLLGAAGGVESVFTSLALHEGVLPPTINFERTDNPDNPDFQFACDPEMDYVPNEPQERQVEAALCNSFGFGGTNGCVAFARWQG